MANKSNKRQQNAAPPSPVPIDTDFKKSLLSGLGAGLIVSLIVGSSGLMGVYDSTIINALLLALYYVAPLPLLIAGFAVSLDAALFGLMLVLFTSAVLVDGQIALIVFGGLGLPTIMLVIMHDHRFWRWSPMSTPGTSQGAANSETSKASEIFGWLFKPSVSDPRLRMGSYLIVLGGYFAVLLALTETVLSGLGLETVHQSLFSAFDISVMTPEQIQNAQEVFPMMELLPSGLAIFLMLWLIGSIKLALLIIRLWRSAEEPRLTITAGALPVWYMIVIGCLAVIASQTDGQTRFIVGNMTIILAIPGLLVGFGLVHHVGNQFRFPWIVVVALYLLIGLGAQYWSLTVVTVMGFLDASLHIREWLTAKLGPKMEKKYA